MKRYFRLSSYSVVYSTRTKGDEIASALKNFAKVLKNDDYLIIDFDGVNAISYSFLDQFLSNVIECDLLNKKEISIIGWSPNLFPVIDKSLQHRHCYHTPVKNELKIICQIT
jgi:hypothetical protein